MRLIPRRGPGRKMTPRAWPIDILTKFTLRLYNSSGTVKPVISTRALGSNTPNDSGYRRLQRRLCARLVLARW